MDGLLAVLTLAVRLLNLALAGYFLSLLVPLARMEGQASFKKTLRLMLLAISMYLAVEIVQVFGLMSIVIFEPVQAIISFMFLLMLIAAMLEVRSNMLMHDHMMRRKLHEKMHDVE